MPLAQMLRRVRKSFTISDDFTGANGAALAGRPTSVGAVPWQVINGVWTIQSNRASTSTLATGNPIAAVDSGAADVDVETDVSTTGNDAVYARIVDGNNWIRAKLRELNSTAFCTVNIFQNDYACCQFYTTACPCGSPASVTACNTCPTPTCTAPNGPCPESGCYANGQTCVVSCGTNLNYYVDVEKMVGGTVTTIASVSVGIGVSITSLRIVTSDTQVQAYAVKGGVMTLLGTWTITDGRTATRHGIGRGKTNSSNGDASAIDNFTLTGTV